MFSFLNDMLSQIVHIVDFLEPVNLLLKMSLYCNRPGWWSDQCASMPRLWQTSSMKCWMLADSRMNTDVNQNSIKFIFFASFILYLTLIINSVLCGYICVWSCHKEPRFEPTSWNCQTLWLLCKGTEIYSTDNWRYRLVYCCFCSCQTPLCKRVKHFANMLTTPPMDETPTCCRCCTTCPYPVKLLYNFLTCIILT